MYAPATPLPAAPLVPVGIASSASAAAVPTPVHTALKVRGFELNVLADHRATVTGALLEGTRAGLSGQLVALQELGRHGWRTLTRTRTGAHGRFRLRYMPRRIGSDWVRLRFAGDAAGLHRTAGSGG